MQKFQSLRPMTKPTARHSKSTVPTDYEVHLAIIFILIPKIVFDKDISAVSSKLPPKSSESTYSRNLEASKIVHQKHYMAISRTETSSMNNLHLLL